jgi:hypothetical protein
MAHNDKMRPIADPYLNRRNESLWRYRNDITESLTAIHRQAYDVRNEARGPRDMAQQIRQDFGMPSGDAPHLEGISRMQNTEQYDDVYDPDNELMLSDQDLMPDANAPIDAGIRAFQESGHGITVFKPMRRDYKVYKEDEED